MTPVIVTGGIDLSVGSVCALVAVCSMIVMRWVAGSPLGGLPYASVVVPVVAGLALAGAIGLINGLLIARLDLSPFVTTLGMLSICRGLTYVITQGRGQAPSGPDVATFFALTNGRLAGLPVQVVYVLMAAAALGVALHHGVWGRHLFAVGGSEPADLAHCARLCSRRSHSRPPRPPSPPLRRQERPHSRRRSPARPRSRAPSRG